MTKMSVVPPPYRDTSPPPEDPEDANSIQHVTVEEPPAYSQLETTTLSPDDVVQPATFSIHGRFIYASPDPTTPPSSDPSYQTNRAILAAAQGSQQFEFQRVEYKYKTSNTTGRPVMSHRGKDIYTLVRHPPFLGWPSQAQAVSTSRKTLGEIHICKSPVFHHGYRANKILPEQEVKRLERKGEKVPKDYFWQIKEAGGDKGEDAWEWKDSKGKTVAYQWKEKNVAQGEHSGSSRDPDGVAAAKEGWIPKLQVLVELDRRTLDSLVAVWCLWLLHLHLEATKVKKTWEDRYNQMTKKRPDDVYQGGFFSFKF
ncbi:hypothetical protein QBC40DRAFT_338411 [Triangularia verruculosa]|uniref:Uncharacterized protein n=1 Tax=Triangularia verruculosa TaxID=2587418 RepID=A0AAN7AXA7_9PEZI|nr:hypothetical protein QBC40DRAFT_338411 [Triangularia verruculosa]